MQFRPALLAGLLAQALALWSNGAFAQAPAAAPTASDPAVTPTAPSGQEKVLAPVVVTAAPFNNDESAQILTPAKVLSGNELRNKMAPSLGATLSNELGVSASAFGAGASRPIIRGLDGPRVKMLQNGMSTADVSGLSSDHAVATGVASARQIEILRGPAALLYGSGAIGGLVNVVNDRIPTSLPKRPTGEAELRLGSADNSAGASLSVDSASGPVGLHLDGDMRNARDYRIPGNAVLGDPASASGRLPNSFARDGNLGLGASYIAGWGHLGASIGTMDQHYGIPTAERSYIDLRQTRFDIDGLVRQPWQGIDSVVFKFGHTDYRHSEKSAVGNPLTNFSNDATEARVVLNHAAAAGWRGSVGLQAEDDRFAALSAATGQPDTVPSTRSSSLAGFAVEERDFGPLRVSAGARLESVRRRPDAAGNPAVVDRSFQLGSGSAGGLWTFAPGYGAGVTVSYAQRAPATEELYSNGPHESTATFDIGNPQLAKETSRNIELTLQKTSGLVRWKTNLYRNKVRNFVYGQVNGNRVDDTGAPDPTGQFTQRFWSQSNATIRGAEAEISYNAQGPGWSARAFADTTRGTLDGAGNLPLQPATRTGVSAGYRQGLWRSGIDAVHGWRQDRLAPFESVPTPSYTQVDADLSYTQRVEMTQLTWFAAIRNLLNQDTRLSTSLLKDVAPLPGRSFIVGVRTSF